jgi:hypothetical protein
MYQFESEPWLGHCNAITLAQTHVPLSLFGSCYRRRDNNSARTSTA